MTDKDSEHKKSFSESEKEILEYWRKNKIFEETLDKTEKGRPFVFYEGPPYANGRPGIHHALARAFKDAILRFKTMRGFYVRRKAGWDTHGLPTEMEVEKKLGLASKKDIEEKVGLEKFVEEAKKSVFGYKEEWERLTDRMAYWLDLKNPYVTMTNGYIESLWSVFSKIAENGYLYKDYKVLPWCPRCGTSLSSHELAQGYKKVKDESVYVKFPLKQPKSYLLVWTTTPWTLPGNIALAVNPKIGYATVEKNGERLILAKSRLEVLEEDYKEINEQKGKDLIGLEYEPLYPISNIKHSTSDYKIVESDFVTAEDGTGILHVAPAFGREDQEIGKKEKLPTPITVDEEGKLKAPGYAWDGRYFKDANPLIIEDLKNRQLLFKTELYEHDYPFCWRCQSPLIYFAKNSWFLKTTAVKNQMIAENKKIGWHPEFIRDGRFGEWLSENVDWAISRERYWGTPLPIWQCNASGCGHQEIIGSLEELDKFGTKRTTRVFIMRHGEADHNVNGYVGPVINGSGLTAKGRKQVEKEVKKLVKEKIDIIISSPLTRAKQTAEIVSKTLGAKIEVNENIYDYNWGKLQGKTVAEGNKLFPLERRFKESPPGGESIPDVRARMMMELRKVVKKHGGKNILIISHGDPIWILNAALEGAEEKDYPRLWYPKTGEAKELKLHNWPYNRAGELDLHRPYIDLIDLVCAKCGGEMKRVKEVADVWFDSGAVPFAQDNFLFGAKAKRPSQYPADYIAEGVDQTRGWFYTLLAVSSLLKLPAPYKNVLVLGLVLDEKGEKMSKSRGNAAEPLTLFEKYGADAVRWYFYTVNQPWDEKLFKESDIAEASRRFLNIFWNSFVYWRTYKDKGSVLKKKPRLLINKWLDIRLNQVGYDATEALEKFDIVRAARMIENFVAEDLSRWYIRRIRDAIRFGSKPEKKEISDIFGLALREVSKLAAPFIPFLTDRMFLEVMKNGSIHLEKWTKFKKPSVSEKKLVEEMNEARRIVSLGLEARAKAGIKVRQPLALLKIRNPKSEIRNKKEFLNLIEGEVNIKKIVFDPKIKDEVELDINITPELKEEGQLRELIRHIQEKRKEAGFKPSDKITFAALTDSKGAAFVKKFEAILKKEAGIKIIIFGEAKQERGPLISLKFNI
ncbi:MAG: class I tRNA ligase family protein [Candidatus Niyogibacteria bacterium]|nr:MAG: class I tRNA ligase family protein [Candidatus Niyogibacteria bacterium]